MNTKPGIAAAITATAVVIAGFVVGGALLSGGADRSTPIDSAARLAAARDVNARDFPSPSRRTTLRHLAYSLIAGPTIVLQRSRTVVAGQPLRFTLVRGPRRRPLVGPSVVYVAANRDARARGPFPAPATAAAAHGAASYASALPRLAPGRYSIIVATFDGDDLLGDWTEMVIAPPA